MPLNAPAVDPSRGPGPGARPERAVRTAAARPLTMPEQIAGSVTSAILRGEYQPGDPVREQELADAFQVSRGPIREALRMLEKSGVVTIVAQRGAHVTRLSAKEVNNLFEIRGALMRLLPQHLLAAGGAIIDTLRAEVAKLEQLAAADDRWDDYAQGSYRIAQVMVEACDNPQLAQILQSLAIQTARYTRIGLREPARRIASAKGWRRFINALKAGDSDRAGDALASLIDESRRAALRALEG